MTINKNFTNTILIGLSSQFEKFITKLNTEPHHNEICSVCNGKGIADKQPCRYEGYLYNFPCYTCFGTGKILVFDDE